MKPSGIGGMAVIEGVMMRNKDEYAIAVRKPNNEIAVEKKTQNNFSDKVKLFKLPIFRGMLAFVDSMVIGVKVLNYAASFFEEEEEIEETKKKKNATKDKNKKNAKQVNKKGSSTQKKNSKANHVDKELSATKETSDQMNTLLMVAAVMISLVFSIAFFMVLPLLISNLFSKIIDSDFWLSLLEAVLRVTMFIGYILAISQMPDIKRVFMYHGAEHKTINCLENGFELTVENVRWQSKEHKRCGTSFMLLVMLISAVFFMVIRPDTLLLRIVSRILLVPVIAGLSYEFIRLAGKSESKIMNILSKPGMWMQGLSTKEPEDAMIEVAIQSVEAVFDWRGFLEIAATTEEVSSTSDSDEKANKDRRSSTVQNQGNRKQGGRKQDSRKQVRNTTLNNVKPTNVNDNPTKKVVEEDDEILLALDKYLDFEDKEAVK